MLTLVFGFLMTGVVLLIVIIGGSWLWRVALDDPRYAARVFDDKVAYRDVLASRAWNRNFGAWDCTFAIVELAPDAAVEPPDAIKSTEIWKYRWGGAWQSTPAARLGDTTRDAIAFCAEYWPESVSMRIRSAMMTAGSYYVRDRVGETVSIYSKPQQIAARIRFGD